jgi:hypothetical protein
MRGTVRLDVVHGLALLFGIVTRAAIEAFVKGAVQIFEALGSKVVASTD